MARGETPAADAPSGKKIDHLARVAFGGVLEPEGFERNGRVLRRVLPDVPAVQVLNLQGSRSNVGSEGTFCVNLGVYFPRLAQLLHPLRRSPPVELDEVQPHQGHISCRLDDVLPDVREPWWLPQMRHRLDLWFDVGPKTNLLELSGVLSRALQSYLVPWLNQHAHPEALLLDKRGDSVVRLAACVALGNRESAAQVLSAERDALRPSAKVVEQWLDAAWKL